MDRWKQLITRVRAVTCQLFSSPGSLMINIDVASFFSNDNYACKTSELQLWMKAEHFKQQHLGNL